MKLFTQESVLEAYPYERSPDFRERVKMNWLNLQKGKTTGKNCMASKLRKQLKIHKHTAFILWLCVCFYLYSKKDGKISFTEKRFTENGGIWIKIGDVLTEIQDDFPAYPELRTLRKQVKRADFGQRLGFLAVDKGFIKGLSEYIYGRLGLIDRGGKKTDRDHLKILQFLMERKKVKKRDLYRKFTISKARCDLLLKRLLETPIAKEDNIIQIKEGFPRNTVWIVYTGP